MKIPPHIADIELIAGHAALDFVNTVHSWTERDARDYFRNGGDVAAWLQHRRLIVPAIADSFAALPPRQAAAVLAAARRLRAHLYSLFTAIIHGHATPAPALDWLNRELARLAPFRRLEARRSGLTWITEPHPDRPLSLLTAVVFAAGELLAGDRLHRIGECPPPEGCGWLFLDTSRNGRRTWCSMQACGNAAKVRRYRARHGT